MRVCQGHWPNYSSDMGGSCDINNSLFSFVRRSLTRSHHQSCFEFFRMINDLVLKNVCWGLDGPPARSWRNITTFNPPPPPPFTTIEHSCLDSYITTQKLLYFTKVNKFLVIKELISLDTTTVKRGIMAGLRQPIRIQYSESSGSSDLQHSQKRGSVFWPILD